MAEAGMGTSPFVLPNMFAPPGQALENTLRRDERQAERQYEIDFRNQRLKEADDWKKLQLIQELTNLDKYQTGEQAADAIGFQRAQDLFQKYTAAAGSMTPAELQYKISQDIGKTTLGMQTMKDELMQSDAAIKQLKSAYPSLNAEALMREHRKDILNRRVSGNDFVNPQIVEQSNFKLDDPDFLSYFVRDSKGLTDAIRNPKYAEDVAVGMGSPNSYTTVKGKLPYFRKLNFDTQKDIEKGFLKKGINPSMEILSSKEKLGGLDVDVLDDEPFGIMDEQARLELAREARQKFNDYDKMSNEEKRIARKNVAVDFVKSIDRSAFDFGTATKPPSIRINTGGGAGGRGKVDLADYDILGDYEPKAITETIPFKVGDTGFNENKTRKIISVIDVDQHDKDLLGGVEPITENGKEFYIIKDNGDWVGDKGQIIYKAKVAQANLDKTAANEVPRGRLELKPNKNEGGKAETVAEKMRRLANQNK